MPGCVKTKQRLTDSNRWTKSSQSFNRHVLLIINLSRGYFPCFFIKNENNIQQKQKKTSD